MNFPNLEISYFLSFFLSLTLTSKHFYFLMKCFAWISSDYLLFVLFYHFNVFPVAFNKQHAYLHICVHSRSPTSLKCWKLFCVVNVTSMMIVIEITLEKCLFVLKINMFPSIYIIMWPVTIIRLKFSSYKSDKYWYEHK